MDDANQLAADPDGNGFLQEPGILAFPAAAATESPPTCGKKKASPKAEAKRRQALLDSFFGTSPLQRFSARLRREGLYHEYKERVKQLTAEGNVPGTAASIARVEFGYEGAVKERELLEQEVALLRMSETEARQAINARNYKARKRMQTFDEVVATLPQTAPGDVEMAWVRSHPAMMRRERMGPNDEGEYPRIVLDVKDLTELNGPAPSKSAVITLQNWVNKPGEFAKTLGTEQKKHATQDAGTKDGKSANSVVKDDRLEDLERLMDQIEGHGDRPLLS